METPSTVPIWRLMVTTAPPAAVRPGGSSEVEADRIAGRASLTPAPVINHPGSSSVA
jgi:hypothetical protein